jgi:hypothetical protein
LKEDEMSDENNPTPTRTATVAPDPRPADRSTDAGLGMFERVNSIVGTTGIGTAPGIGGATEQSVHLDALPGIAGVESSPIGLPAGDAAELSRFNEEDDRHWRETHGKTATANAASNYEEYQPAYRYGTDAAHLHKGKTWDEASSHLESGWDKAKGESSLTWAHVKDSVRDAWHRVERAFSGDPKPDAR